MKGGEGRSWANINLRVSFFTPLGGVQTYIGYDSYELEVLF